MFSLEEIKSIATIYEMPDHKNLKLRKFDSNSKDVQDLNESEKQKIIYT